MQKKRERKLRNVLQRENKIKKKSMVKEKAEREKGQRKIVCRKRKRR